MCSCVYVWGGTWVRVYIYVGNHVYGCTWKSEVDIGHHPQLLCFSSRLLDLFSLCECVTSYVHVSLHACLLRVPGLSQSVSVLLWMAPLLSSLSVFFFFCACELIPHRATAALSGTTSQGRMYIPCPSVWASRGNEQQCRHHRASITESFSRTDLHQAILLQEFFKHLKISNTGQNHFP